MGRTWVPQVYDSHHHWVSSFTDRSGSRPESTEDPLNCELDVDRPSHPALVLPYTPERSSSLSIRSHGPTDRPPPISHRTFLPISPIECFLELNGDRGK